MNILTKHKKNEIEGFKKFVFNLETTTDQKLKDILEIAFLEDPVYVRWIIPNIIGVDYLLSIEEEHVLKIYNIIPQPIEMFLYSFINSPWENDFIESKIPVNLKKLYLEEKELSKSKITKSQQDAARFTIIRAIRDLLYRAELPKFEWKLPTEAVLNGSHFVPTKTGEFLLKYEEGIVALQGCYETKLREGAWKHYYPNGTVMAEGSYKKGEKTGEWYFNYPSGTRKAEGYYEDNLKEGEWFSYDKNEKMKIIFYERGKLV